MTKTKNHSEEKDKNNHSNSAEEKNLSAENKIDGDSCGEKVEIFTSALSEKTAEIEKLTAEIDSLKDLMQRRQADFENYKKRAAKQQEDFKKFYLRDFALDIITINDDLIRAYDSSADVKDSSGESFESFAEGVSMISKRIIETLAKYGIEVIEAERCEFDPNCHEAVEIEMNNESEADMVAYVYQKGFRMDDMVIRSCKVKVSKGCRQQPADAEGPEAQMDNGSAAESVQGGVN